MAPSWHALQELLFILENCCLVFDISCNVKKTVCMNSCPREKSQCITGVFPLFTIIDKSLKFVAEFCNLGHIIDDLLSDDNDIKREIRNMYVKTNMLIRRFGRCLRSKKTRLFRTYCACLYGSALWTIYSKTSLRRFRSCYHKSLNMFFLL
jgi:hypothetical protein